MAYTKYSLTPANNNAAPPDGAPEGMLPSAVNDTMRDMMAQIRDCGDGIRGGTYTMTAPVITGGSISGSTMSSNVITGGSINNTPIGGTTRAAGSFTTVTTANDSSISGLTIGKGGGSVSGNTAVGNNAMAATSTANFNSAFGGYALTANTSGTVNSAFGYAAGYSNTTGYSNSFFGRQSGYYTTTGVQNTAIGESALFSNTTASNNTAVGYQAGYSNTTGAYNTSIGHGSLYSNTTGYDNAALGYQAGYSNTTGFNQTFIGDFAGQATTGSKNTFLGRASGYLVTTGASNTILGAYSGNQGGLDIRTSSNYVVLSDGDGNPRLIVDGSGYFFKNNSGSGSFISGQNAWQLRADQGSIQLSNSASTGTPAYFYTSTGAAGTITTNGLTTSYNTSSDQRLKNDIGIITETSVIENTVIHNFTWKTNGVSAKGVFAQEAQLVNPSAVTKGTDEIDENGNLVTPWSVDYSKYVPDLIVYCQQLNKKLEAQALEIATLKGK